MLHNNNGAVFVMVLIMVSLLAILGATFASIVTFEMRNVDWQRQRVQGFYIAEAGIAKGWSVLKDSISGSDSLNNILVGDDGIANTDDDGVLDFGPSVNFGAGSYSVVVIDNDDGDGDYFSDSDDIVKIVSTGTIGKIERTINVMFTAAWPFVPEHAVITGGNLLISEEPTIQGSYGSIHINGNFTISGSPSVSKDITASGSVDISGNPIIGGEILSGVPSISIPIIDPEFYKDSADYELRSDGGVFDVSNQTLTYPDEFNGWAWDGVRWSFNGETGFDGTYYIEGDAKVSGEPGTDDEPWRATIIATGSIEIFGEPKMQPETTGLLFVAGGDIKISSELYQYPTYEAAILAHEQIMINGEPSIEGIVIAENGTDISSMVTASEIGGEVTITYNGDFSPLLPKVYTGELNLLSWY